MIQWIIKIIGYFSPKKDTKYLDEAFMKNKKDEWRHDA